MSRITAFCGGHFAPKYTRRYGRDNLIFEIEGRAFHSILPLLPKPWLARGMGSGRLAPFLDIPQGMGKERNLLKMTRACKVSVIFTLCLASRPALFLKECHHLLRREGKILIGFIPRESPWGRFYMETQKGRRPTHRWGQFYSLKKMEHIMMDAGFSIQGYISTLFQKPGAVKVLENPMRGYLPQAGFLIIMGERMN
jgi:hypothetical protein